MKINIMSIMFLIFMNLLSGLAISQTNPQMEVIERDSLRIAMKYASSLGYETTVTTNGIRYQVDVLLYLLRSKMNQHQGDITEAPLLLIRYNDWYDVYKKINCQGKEIPKYIEKANKYQQNIIIDYNRQGIIKQIKHGGTPDAVANVTLCWPHEIGLSFSYQDTLSIPKMLVTNERIITYRLLKYDDLIICDQITGLKGKALTGFLSFFGDAEMTQYRTTYEKGSSQYVRMSIEPTGFWVILTWLISSDKKMTITPEGITKEGIAEKKPQLDREIELKYYPFKKSAFCGI